MKHIKYKSKLKLSPWRKISLGSWKPKGDSSIYAFEDFNVDKVLEFCKQQSISFSSFVIKALSSTINQNHRINSVIRFGNMYQREKNTIFVHTLPNEITDDLSGVLIEEAFTKDINEVDVEFKNEIKKVKEGEEKHTKSKKSFKIIPAIFSKYVLNFLSFLMYSLNIYLKIIPSPKDPFGSVMLTNIGSLNIQKAFCPIAPYTKIPMVVSLGRIELKPIVLNDKITKGNISTFGFTFDHRIMDGIHFSKFIETFQSFFINPKLILK
ncbi:2-oxo acid dehydrogenase subunit E2 [Polaribacter sp. Hel_I_88]|uniref:2-oxo acid dehydrogenase subunit E2 n=1 Tax=Polaribacter sp. Hel_I_88 TaxID=1250006 RepID=UPI0004793109|nr:2-oxo acid dehydrogenase subunit E2 [Polaribacter sp. Hel_I_88]